MPDPPIRSSLAPPPQAPSPEPLSLQVGREEERVLRWVDLEGGEGEGKGGGTVGGMFSMRGNFFLMCGDFFSRAVLFVKSLS